MSWDTDLIIVDSAPLGQAKQLPVPLEVAIGTWLDNKYKRSKSDRTQRAYRDTLTSFREFMQAQGLDLDSPGDLSGYLQVWSGLEGVRRNRNGAIVERHPVSVSTINHRLAVVSSFYRYAARRAHLKVANPAEAIERAPEQDYAKAQPLSTEAVKTKLKAIDQTTLAGQRDYALLQVALNTGRRRAELAALRWGDLHLEGNQIFVTWPHAKGGKTMHDLLDPRVSAPLMRYLHALYGAQLGTLSADAPIWVAVGPHAGHPLTPQAIADICLAHLGTSKAHTTRHTFAHTMEEAGAKVSDIQARLGHSSLQTTGAYLAALKSAYNPQAEQLATLFGAE